MKNTETHPMLNRRCIVRTYSAGVHIGTVVAVDGMEVHLKDCLRLWKWEGGGLSLSHIAEKGIVRGRLNASSEVYLTNAIEFLPITEIAEGSFKQWIE